MDFETWNRLTPAFKLIKYKFDPMDFETVYIGFKKKGDIEYKFDPMDFETLCFGTKNKSNCKV